MKIDAFSFLINDSNPIEVIDHVDYIIMIHFD